MTILGGKKYGLVIVDDFSRLIWIIFLSHWDDSCEAFKVFCICVQNEKGFCISSIKTDHRDEFENHVFESFVKKMAFLITFFFHRTPQQKGVVERKNILL